MTSKELYTKGTKVWIPDPEDVWQSATISADYRSGVIIVVSDKDGQPHQIKIKEDSNLPPLRNPSILLGQNDLTSLSYLHEPAVIHNLRVRFCERNAIYTYCGIVLVAINPYYDLPIYGEESIMVYHGRSMGDLDPHIFAVSEEAFTKLEREAKDQSVIVSGESGAGKTVSAKYAMRYFATVGGNVSETNIERKVLASSPITEAIGNAKTTRNDNSSRFGKFISIGFDKYYRICGASLRTYLLEKSRVVYQAPGERNYHIFYQLCDTRSQYPHLKLDDPEAFHYLNQGGSPIIEGVEDKVDFKETMRALATLGFEDKDIENMLVVLAVILHLGNIQFHDGNPDSVKGEDGAFISDTDQPLAIVCELLGVSRPELMRWLTHRRIASGNEVIISRWNKETAMASRDALAKLVYARLFSRTVANVNRALYTAAKEHHHIGVLDIYGFETFEINSFEQFCINYANEKLQQQFNQHVFKLEQEEYIKEKIEWTMITFYDNQPCIELIETRLGILNLLDEECRVPGGSDKAFAGKLRYKCKNYEHFSEPRFGDTTFIVKHFADDVEYDTGGFLEKNRDTVSEELVDSFKTSSKCGLMVELCLGEEESSGTVKSSNTLPVPQKRKPNLSINSATSPLRRSSGNRVTVGAQFRASLAALMSTLSATTPHYVRCIKPNDTKSPFLYDAPRVASQLRACGVLETIRISAAGFPSRWLYQDFFNRYRLLCHSSEIKRDDVKKTCKIILDKFVQDTDKYRWGLTKIFFRAGEVAYLEKLRGEKQRRSCVLMQKTVRGFLARRRYQAKMKAIRGLQRYGRGYLARKYAEHLRRTKAALTLQRHWRGRSVRLRYNAVRRTILGIQTRARGYLCRRKVMRLRFQRAAIIVQKYFRGWLARVKYNRMQKNIVTCQAAVRRFLARRVYKHLRVEARSIEHVKKLNKGLENKIIELQQKLQSATEENKQLKPKLAHMDLLKSTVDEYKLMEGDYKQLKEQSQEKDSVLNALQAELTSERASISCLRMEKTEIEKRYVSERDALIAERDALKIELGVVKEASERNITEIEKKFDEEKRQLLQKLEDERSSSQKLLAAQYDLQEQVDKLQREQSKAHKRSVSDASTCSQQETNNQQEDDFGYGSVRSTETTRPALEAVNWSAGAAPVTAPTPMADAGLVLRLQRKLSALQSDLSRTASRARDLEEKLANRAAAFQTSNASSEERFKISELEIENNQLRTQLQDIYTASDVAKQIKDQLNAMQQELVRRREECVQLRTVLANQTVNLKSLTTSGFDNSIEDGEMAEAFEAQKRIARQLEEELINEKKFYKETLDDYKQEIDKLKIENDKHVKLLSGTLSGTAATQAEQFAQTEIVRLTADNLALQDRIDKLSESCRRYKAQLKALADRLEHMGFKDVQQILDSDPSTISKLLGAKGTEIVPVLRKKEREYLGMLEYESANEGKIIQRLIFDLTPEVAVTLLPCLPAYILFMMLRHMDHSDDEPKMHLLIKASRSAIKTVVRKKQNDLEYVSLWLSNMLRLLNNLRQYSGDTAYTQFNTPQQNSQCLRIFDLSEYRQVFSDTAVWIYHCLISLIQNSLERLIVPSVLEYEEVQDIVRSKDGKKTPTSPSNPAKLTLDLTVILNRLKVYHISADLILRIFKQLVYYICAYSLNQLLLRKDLCCWAKGLQIRYNVSYLEVWLKDNLAGLQGEVKIEEILSLLKPITETVHLLQARKTMGDVQSFVDLCPSLTTMQVCKILNMYTTMEEYEQKVNRDFIHEVQKKLEERPHAQNEPKSLLMDTKLIFSVQFPFEPSPVRLEDVELAPVLKLAGLLTKL